MPAAWHGYQHDVTGTTGTAGAPAGRRGFVLRITTATAFGEGLDGYDLGIISVVVPLIVTQFGLSAIEEGLLGAASLAGIFFGGPIFGFLTDRYGRRTIFVCDLVAFVVLGALQGLVTNGGELLVLRFLLGFAIGAEYAIGQTMLAEFVPSAHRGALLSSLQAAWYGGFLLAVVVAYVLDGLGVDWPWILATGAVPGLLTLLLRQGLPESPRWLASVGREDEAREIVDEHLGGDFYEDEELGEEEQDPRFADLFAKDMWRTTVFACTFFTCLVAPYFAIFTFAPQVFDAAGIDNPKAVIIGTNAIAFLGAVTGAALVERTGRRSMLLTSFWVMVVTLVVIGVWGAAPALVVVACFVGFAFFNAMSGDLTGVYPAEVFPSELRGSGTGLAAATSRIGAAGGTFLLPVSIAHLGIGTSMVISAAVCAVGLAVTYAWAPETTDQTLTATGDAS
jgi:MFS transporter, putative metabolite transport protein